MSYSSRSNAQATRDLQLTVGRRSNANGEATAGTAEYSGTNTSWLTRLAEDARSRTSSKL